MKVYMVTYDYKDKSKYNGLYDELKKFGKWWHYIDSSWLIVSDLDSNTIYARLKPYLDNDINLLIIEVGADRQGWLPEKAWAWIKTNVGEKNS